MAQYTTEVRSICEHYADLQESAGYNSIDSIIEKSAPKIFSFDFPLFDENYRLALEKKILRHYYTREIGDETVGLWKLRLETRLNEIMPYYNQLYKSTLYEFNPFYDVDTVRSHQTKNDGTTTTNSNQDYAGNIKGSGSTTDKDVNESTSTDTVETNGTASSNSTDSVETNGTASSNSTSDNTSTSSGSNTSETTSSGTGDTKNRYSDTPQGSLQNIENNTYLTNATIVDSTTSTKENSSGSSSSKGTSNTTNKGNSENHSTTVENGKRNSTRNVNGTSENNQDSTNNTKYQSTGTAKSMEEYVEHVTGKVGTTSYSDMLLKFRKTFLNIDMMIINDLQPLFFELW